MSETVTMMTTYPMAGVIVTCDLCRKASWQCNRTRTKFESRPDTFWTVCEDCS